MANKKDIDILMLKPDHYKFFQDEVKRQEALQIELAIAASLADHKPENFS